MQACWKCREQKQKDLLAPTKWGCPSSGALRPPPWRLLETTGPAFHIQRQAIHFALPCIVQEILFSNVFLEVWFILWSKEESSTRRTGKSWHAQWNGLCEIFIDYSLQDCTFHDWNTVGGVDNEFAYVMCAGRLGHADDGVTCTGTKS